MGKGGWLFDCAVCVALQASLGETTERAATLSTKLSDAMEEAAQLQEQLAASETRLKEEAAVGTRRASSLHLLARNFYSNFLLAFGQAHEATANEVMTKYSALLEVAEAKLAAGKLKR